MSDVGKRDSASVDSEGKQLPRRRRGLLGLYYNPITQIVMLGFVCFMGPGLYNALNGLGGAGQLDASTSANSNAALYSTFAFFAFFAGSINNKFGPRLTLLIGISGYAIYIGSFLALNLHKDAKGFVIAAGAIDGFCAGLLWTAQGSLMLAYPAENQKGLFIGIFWGIFNLGGVVGAAVSLGQNFKSTASSTFLLAVLQALIHRLFGVFAVADGTYIVFLILASIGVLIPMLMADPSKMFRSDGSKVTTPRHPSWKTEIFGLWVTLRSDPAIVFLFPMFFASNWFYTWQFNDYNGALFDIRARSLNNLVYWLAQMFGSISIGLLLDSGWLQRRVRAFAGWTVLFCMVFIVHIWAFFYQRNYTRQSVDPSVYTPIDIYDKDYPAHIWLYIFCALLDSMWQTTAYWMMGAMSNDPAKLAFLTGFYKSIQSAGAAGVWRADAIHLPFMNIFLSTWVLLVAGLLFALPMLYLRVKNYTDYEDETMQVSHCVAFSVTDDQYRARMDDEGNVIPLEKLGDYDRP
ncbi:hypothetical protein DFH11DRAFT_1729406 [Phellopilus nigrolimitatus]|nr:hypothetical protein DFH11DRAFT_1729406 [Phellopilus nigrolimitatus]